jgi:class 3 adenylate cyclase
LWESFSADHLVPDFERLYRALAEHRTIIRFDPRTVGLSQRGAVDTSLEAWVKDIVAVVDAADVGEVSIFANVASVAVAILFAAQHPSRVKALVLSNGWARMQDVWPLELLKSLADMARVNWPVAAQTVVPRSVSPAHDQAWVQAYIESTTGEEAAQSILGRLNADATLVLGDVAAPTLVLHYQEHGVVPFRLGQQLAASIPKARLVPIRFRDFDEDWLATMVSAIDQFLPRRTSEPSVEVTAGINTFRTVFFTDLVGHTEMMSRLGDERGREVLREHERITREVLKAHGGTEVKTMGDGFMASFGSVTKAVECAIALQRAMDEWNATERAQQAAPLRVRVGLNAGEPIEEDGPDGRSDLFGATVILASRIAAKAEGGEILVADTVRGLCSGKGFLFADRGEFVAKGFEEPVRVYEVSWGE